MFAMLKEWSVRLLFNEGTYSLIWPCVLHLLYFYNINIRQILRLFRLISWLHQNIWFFFWYCTLFLYVQTLLLFLLPYHFRDSVICCWLFLMQQKYYTPCKTISLCEVHLGSGLKYFCCYLFKPIKKEFSKRCIDNIRVI